MCRWVDKTKTLLHWSFKITMMSNIFDFKVKSSVFFFCWFMQLCLKNVWVCVCVCEQLNTSASTLNNPHVCSDGICLKKNRHSYWCLRDQIHNWGNIYWCQNIYTAGSPTALWTHTYMATLTQSEKTGRKPPVHQTDKTKNMLGDQSWAWEVYLSGIQYIWACSISSPRFLKFSQFNVSGFQWCRSMKMWNTVQPFLFQMKQMFSSDWGMKSSPHPISSLDFSFVVISSF